MFLFDIKFYVNFANEWLNVFVNNIQKHEIYIFSIAYNT